MGTDPTSNARAALDFPDGHLHPDGDCGPGSTPGARFRTPSILPHPCSSERGAPELPFLSRERKSPPCTSPCASSTLN